MHLSQYFLNADDKYCTLVICVFLRIQKFRCFKTYPDSAINPKTALRLLKAVRLRGLRKFQVFVCLALNGTAFVLMIVLLELIFLFHNNQ